MSSRRSVILANSRSGSHGCSSNSVMMSLITRYNLSASSRPRLRRNAAVAAPIVIAVSDKSRSYHPASRCAIIAVSVWLFSPTVTTFKSGPAIGTSTLCLMWASRSSQKSSSSTMMLTPEYAQRRFCYRSVTPARLQPHRLEELSNQDLELVRRQIQEIQPAVQVQSQADMLDRLVPVEVVVQDGLDRHEVARVRRHHG